MKLSGSITVLLLILVATAIGCAQVVKTERSRNQGYLGVGLSDVTKDLQDDENLTVDKGAYVDNVVEDSPAEKAGIREGDVILKVGDVSIDDASDCSRAIRKIKPHTDVSIEIARKAERKTLTATIGRSRTSMAFSYSVPGRIPRPVVPSVPRALSIYFGNTVDGLELEPVTKQLGEYFSVPGNRGLLVKSVEKRSTAEKAGFKAGDVITKVENHSVRDVDDFMSELRDTDQDTVAIQVIRKGSPVTLSLEHESDSKWEDDSGYLVSPDMNSLRFELEALKKEKMNTLKMDLMKMKEQLRQEMQSLRKSLHHVFEEL